MHVVLWWCPLLCTLYCSGAIYCYNVLWSPLLCTLYSDGMALDESNGRKFLAEFLENDHSLQHVTVINTAR